LCFVGFGIPLSLSITAAVLLIQYLDYKNRAYRIDKLTFATLILISSTILYGRQVYGETLFYIGGPKNSFEELYIKDTISINNTKTDRIYNKEIIYSNSNTYYIKFDDSTLFQINRERIENVNYKITKPWFYNLVYLLF